MERLLADTAVLLPGPLDPDPRRPHRTDHLLQALQRNPHHLLNCMAGFHASAHKLKYSRVRTFISCYRVRVFLLALYVVLKINKVLKKITIVD